MAKTIVKNAELSGRMSSKWNDKTRGPDGLTFRERRSIQAKLQRARELNRTDQIAELEAKLGIRSQDPTNESAAAASGHPGEKSTKPSARVTKAEPPIPPEGADEGGRSKAIKDPVAAAPDASAAPPPEGTAVRSPKARGWRRGGWR